MTPEGRSTYEMCLLTARGTPSGTDPDSSVVCFLCVGQALVLRVQQGNSPL